MNITNKKIKNIIFLTKEIKTFNLFEIALDIENIQGNVYDYKEISLDIQLLSPSGEKYSHPGFYYIPYDFKTTGEILGVSNELPSWRFRITPTENGNWSYLITLSENGTKTEEISGNFYAEKSDDNRGFIKIEPTIGRNFTFENGDLYIPIGQNICWQFPDNRADKSARYITGIIKKASPYGMNFARLWMVYWCLPFQTTDSAPSDLTKGQYAAAQYDKIFETLKDEDVYISLTIFTHGMFSKRIDTKWDLNPYNIKNKGGYLKEPQDFFTDVKAIHDTKCFLRFLIARYGYSRNILDWELFNEADFADGEMDVKLKWHKIMVDFIRETDAYSHMITTSGAFATCPISREQIFDFTFIHWYNYKKLRQILDFYKPDWEKQKRPSIYGEMGINEVVPSIDKNLITFHQQNWLGIMGGQAATCMTWFWEQLDAVDGYSDYEPLAAFAKSIPWTASDINTIDKKLKTNNSQVEIFGYKGNEFAYLWIVDDEYNHRTKIKTEFKDFEFFISLNTGKYRAEFIDTWSGKTVEIINIENENNNLKIKTPTWTRDIAVKITLL